MNKCKISGCENAVTYKSAQLCNACYLRIRRRGTAEKLVNPPSAEEKAEVIRLYMEGVSCIKIAKQFGWGRDKPRFWLKRWGIDRRPVGFQKGNKPANYIGKRSDGYGYVLVHAPDHPSADKHGCVREHRLVMENIAGRRLKRNELVHHKDGNKSNNSPENLEIMENPDHTKHHNPRTGTGLGVIECAECHQTVNHFAKGMCKKCHQKIAARNRYRNNPEKYREYLRSYRARKSKSAAS
jgi:transposase-like protein